jgi:acetyl/propionyl-CoA carboxylase alpha subunit/acetyl-CoA carboxylase carboxyltransferase component
VLREEDFTKQYEAALREAESTSGKAAVFIEKFIRKMRHIEVQVIADGTGFFVIMGERDCTTQRKSKKQKIVEEEVSNSLRPDIKEQAVAIAQKIMSHPEMKDYKGPGTIEVIWDAETDRLYFMEMNTRLQVEHTVSEMVTGKNLLKAQLELGAGLPLSFREAHPKGHSIEVRITAEDPFDQFKPSTGRVLYYREPHAHKTARIRVRVDSGIEAGTVVTADYDPMLAKLIVWGEKRQDALEGLRNALDQFEILGVKTNIPFLKRLIASEEFQRGEIPNTNWVEEVFLQSDGGKADYSQYPQALLTVAIQTFLQRKDALLASKQDQLSGVTVDPQVKLSFQGQAFETEVYEQGPGHFLVKIGSQMTEVNLIRAGDYLYNLQMDGIQRRALVKQGLGRRDVLLDNVNYDITVAGEGDLGPGAVFSPMPGKVVKIPVKPGDVVKKGDPLLIIEAMKLENSILSDKDGVVREVKVKEDTQVEERDLLVMLEVEGQQGGAQDKVSSGAKWEGKLALGTTLLQTFKDRGISELSYYDLIDMMGQFRSYFKGYDGPTLDLLEVLPKLRAAPRKGLQNFIGELINDYLQVESLFTPVNWSHWVRFRQMGIFTDEKYKAQVHKVLEGYGFSSAEPSPELEEALFRLTQSHNRRREKVRILTDLLPWVAEEQMVDLLPLMPPLARLYLDGVPKSFSNWVNEHQWKLQRRISGAEEVSSLEREFDVVLQGVGEQRDKAVQELFGNSVEVLPFLLRKALQSENAAARENAVQLLQQYFYGSRYRAGAFTSVDDGYLTDLASPSSRALDILLPQALKDNEFQPYLQRLDERNLDPAPTRVTFIVQQNAEQVNFHTFERAPETRRWEEKVYLRGSHPMMAEDRGLDRWRENFNIDPMDHVLSNAAHVLAYSVHAKQDPKDNRYLVIGEHRGRITPDRFEGERVENRLVNDFRHLLRDPNYVMEEDSRIVWSWLPYALKEKGMLPEGLDPFSFGVLAASPAELIKRFEINESTLRRVASFYHGKVKSVPEVERVVMETAMAVDQIQDEGSPTLADIYIRQPVNMSDAEITLLAFRMAPQFVGKNLEKTTVHFKRWEDGKLNGYLAEIRIPGRTRFEVVIKESKEDMPPHRVRTALERKRFKQQGRGRLYVYDQVRLIDDIVREEFFPRGNAPVDAVRIQEMILDNGALVPSDRGIGKNNISKVAFEVTVRLPLDPAEEEVLTRSFMVIADDYTVKSGSMGREEGRLYKAVVDRAIEKGIPQLYLDESVGAFIGFSHQLLPFLHHDTENDKNVIYVRGEDLEKPIPNSDRKVSDLIEIGRPYGDNRFPVTTILGMGAINTESLNGSGMAGEAQSRARAHVPTATIVSNPSVGIATYLARLSEYVIMLKGSYLGLTGRKAINNTFGTTYKTETEIAGTEIMADSGVAYQVARNEREALRSFIKWIHYQPVQTDKPPVQFRLAPKDAPANRDIGPVVAQLIKGRGQAYSTKELDRAVFDPDSVEYVQGDGYWGRRVNVGYARLGGIPVGIASMEMKPKAQPGENPNMLYPGGLDGDSSQKLADHIHQVNRLGLPFIFNASITGFLPRQEDHRDKRVVPGGARILDALREFRQPAIIWIPPQGFLYGGAWVVIDRNINPNVVMVADHTAQLGILGSAAANDLPLVTAHHHEPADKKKTRVMLDLQNTPHRAQRVGSIHHLIEETGKTPEILHQLLTGKLSEIQAEREAGRKRQDLIRQLTGALDFMGVGYALHPNGEIEMRFQDGTIRTGLESARMGLQVLYKDNPLNTLRTVLGRNNSALKPGGESDGE